MRQRYSLCSYYGSGWFLVTFVVPIILSSWSVHCSKETAYSYYGDLKTWMPLDVEDGLPDKFDEMNALQETVPFPAYTQSETGRYRQVTRRSQISPQSMQAFAPLMQRVRDAIANKRLRPHPRGALPWIYRDKAFDGDALPKPDQIALATEPVITKELVPNKSTKLCYMNPVACFGRFGRRING